MARMTAVPPAADCGAPESVLRVPSMMNPHERSVLYWLAKTQFSGSGTIVDAGLFLGASTIAFAEGLRARSETAKLAYRPPIASYDMAIWTRGMDHKLAGDDARALLAGREAPRDGASYAPLLREILWPYRDLVELHIGDIRNTLVCNRPIEIAFYDCLKTASVEREVFQRAGPWYEPGTLVVHEDYFFDWAFEVKIRQELLSEYFDYLGNAGQMAVFRARTRLPPRLFSDDPTEKLTVELKASLLRRAAERATAPRFKASTLLALADFLRMEARPRAALDVLGEAEALVTQAKGRFARRLQQIRRAASEAFGSGG
jgi:hypothetical protein